MLVQRFLALPLFVITAIIGLLCWPSDKALENLSLPEGGTGVMGNLDSIDFTSPPTGNCAQTEQSTLLQCSMELMRIIQDTSGSGDPTDVIRNICSPAGRSAVQCMFDVLERCPELQGNTQLPLGMNLEQLEMACQALDVSSNSTSPPSGNCAETEQATLLQCSMELMRIIQDTSGSGDPTDVIRNICSPAGRSAVQCMFDVLERCPELQGNTQLPLGMNLEQLEMACQALDGSSNFTSPTSPPSENCVQTEQATLLQCSMELMRIIQNTSGSGDPTDMTREICSPAGRSAVQCMFDILERCPELQTQLRLGMSLEQLDMACRALDGFTDSTGPSTTQQPTPSMPTALVAAHPFPWWDQGSRSVTALNITYSPRDKTVVDRSIAHFFCKVDGYPPPSVYWERGGRRLGTRSSRYQVMNVTGGSVLKIEPVRERWDQTAFACVVEDILGQMVQKARANLHVLPQEDEEELPSGFPRIVLNPPLKAVEKGRPVEMNCRAEPDSGPLKVNIYWMRNGVPLQFFMIDPRITVTNEGSLMINETKESDEGSYECVAENEVGLVYSYRANLYVRVRRVPPHFTVTPDDVSVDFGSSVNLTCVAVGSPMPVVGWREQVGSDGVKSVGGEKVGKNILELTNVIQSKTYMCVASNDLGSIEHVVRVTVLEPTKQPVSFTEVPERHVIVEARGSVNLTCAATGSPQPLVVWTAVGQIIPCNNGSIGRNVLILTNIVQNKTYRCTASNSFQNVQYYVQVHITGCTSESCRPKPPEMILQPFHYGWFGPQQIVMLQCGAFGNPMPTYYWRKNGQLLDLNVPTIGHVNGAEIVLKNSSKLDEGYYQCFAENMYGTTASRVVLIRHARLEPFPPVPLIQTHRVLEYTSLRLPCVPPRNSPPKRPIWLKKKKDGRLSLLQYSERISMDPEGKLHFANVEQADFEHGYVCSATNTVLRSTVTGPEHRIIVTRSQPQRYPVNLAYASPGDLLAVKGKTLGITCIFSGRPTPVVSWNRNGHLPVNNGSRVGIFGNGHELVLSSVEESDAGYYECVSTDAVTKAAVARLFTVRVESEPYWIEEPQSQEVELGGTAEFSCRAGGAPEPRIIWYINGVPIEDVTDPRIAGKYRLSKPNNYSIQLTNVSRQDCMSIQCNATNKHGYIFADFTLTVQDCTSPPTENCVQTEQATLLHCSNELIRIIDLNETSGIGDTTDLMRKMCSPAGRSAMHCMFDILERCPELQGDTQLPLGMSSEQIDMACQALGGARGAAPQIDDALKTLLTDVIGQKQKSKRKEWKDALKETRKDGDKGSVKQIKKNEKTVIQKLKEDAGKKDKVVTKLFHQSGFDQKKKKLKKKDGQSVKKRGKTIKHMYEGNGKKKSLDGNKRKRKWL